MNTDEMLTAAGETVEYAKMYVEQKTDYIKLEVAKQIAKTTSAVVTGAVVGVLALLVLLFLTIAIACFIAEAVDSFGWAFLIIAGVYALIALAIYLLRRPLVTNPTIKMIVQNILD